MENLERFREEPGTFQMSRYKIPSFTMQTTEDHNLAYHSMRAFSKTLNKLGVKTVLAF